MAMRHQDRVQRPMKTLRERLCVPGMIGALAAVDCVAVSEAGWRWKNLQKDVSPAMRERLMASVARAERYLLRRKQMAERLEMRREQARVILRRLMHGGTKWPGTVTLPQVAREAGLNYQVVVNFRSSERPISWEKLRKLESAMRRMGLMGDEATARGKGATDAAQRVPTEEAHAKA